MSIHKDMFSNHQLWNIFRRIWLKSGRASIDTRAEGYDQFDTDIMKSLSLRDTMILILPHYHIMELSLAIIVFYSMSKSKI